MISRRAIIKNGIALSLSANMPSAVWASAGKKGKQPKIDRVDIGVQSFSFHDLPSGDPQRCIPMLIQYMQDVGLSECEVMSKHIEPFTGFAGLGYWSETANDDSIKQIRQEARKWRLTVPMQYYGGIRERFGKVGLSIPIYNFAFNETFTDEEIDRSFEAGKHLGSFAFSGSLRLNQAKRVAPFAERHKMYVAMHNHNNLVDPEEFATPESFQRALDISEYFMVNLDLGHFTAANFDSIAFIQKHHARILNLHLRDREKNNGPMTPFGQGDTPLKEILRLIRDEKWPIRCNIEFAYGSLCTDVYEVRRCVDFCREVLA